MLEIYQDSEYSFKSITHLNDNLQYLDFIDNTYQFETKVVTPDEAYSHQGDLFSLFKLMGVSPELYVFTMYLNEFTHPHQYDGSLNIFRIAIVPKIPRN